MYKVNLTYFKSTGKYYSEGSYTSEKEHIHQIFEEVGDKNKKGDLPGMMKGYTADFISIDVPDHPHNHPHLTMKDWKEIRDFKDILERVRERERGEEANND